MVAFSSNRRNLVLDTPQPQRKLFSRLPCVADQRGMRLRRAGSLSCEKELRERWRGQRREERGERRDSRGTYTGGTCNGAHVPVPVSMLLWVHVCSHVRALLWDMHGREHGPKGVGCVFSGVLAHMFAAGEAQDQVTKATKSPVDKPNQVIMSLNFAQMDILQFHVPQLHTTHALQRTHRTHARS